ncbi:YopX family protein [Brevibacillus parabrevis]|uniref:YopX protein domain-containing protein n=1 Tax=Brevibacillus parabrevis TaxID=54914 RepID=A0A4Y3PR63_BREPA|nr:YopX family protein [Brevibacillus parabrevis]RNB95012.1 hypothetical protein EDM60_14175 [Brevibacillus parabrevis]GEB35883.1 hypothetical protein BPA01_54630 [Brevibacillus parabrevis]
MSEYGYIWIIPVLQIHYILTGKIDVRDCSIEKYEVDPASVGQISGLPDKNGKEIFEGDIFQTDNYPNMITIDFGV